MRAAYIIWGDEKYIDQLIEVGGIDTLIVSIQNMPAEPLAEHYDSYDKTISLIKKYKGRVRILLNPFFVRTWVDIPDGMCFVDQSGIPKRQTPCPTCKEYFFERFQHVNVLADDIDGVVWDLEHYGEAREDIIPIYDTKRPYRCHCDRCKNLSTSEQWDTHRRLWRAFMAPYKITGFMPYEHPWVMNLLPSETRYLFSEKTYERVDFFQLVWEKIKRFFTRTKLKIVSGIWIEFQSDSKLKNNIEKLNKWPLNQDGFWLYAHQRYSDKAPYPCPGPICNKIDSVFLDNLQKIEAR